MPTAPRTEVFVEGTVAGPSREPLVGTFLSFLPSERGLEDYAVTATDSSGAYSVRLLEGTYRVDVSPPPWSGLLSRTQQVKISNHRSRLNFAFVGYRVTGRVVDPKGTVLDSGRVHAHLEGAADHGHASSVLEQGRYLLVLPAGTYSFDAVTADSWSGFPPARQEFVSIATDTTIDFQLGGISVSGKVLGPDGLPMGDVGVEARGSDLWVRNRTASDGGYQLYVRAGSYHVWFRPPHPFYIIPRVVGPLIIAAPTSVDGDLSGVEWSGTIRRSDTNDPAPEVSVAVRVSNETERVAAISTGPQGAFRFILEGNLPYDLSTYDGERQERVVWLQGLTATADTTFEIQLPPLPAP